MASGLDDQVMSDHKSKIIGEFESAEYRLSEALSKPLYHVRMLCVSQLHLWGNMESVMFFVLIY